MPLAPCFYQLTILDRYRPDEKGRAFELIVGMQLVRTGCDLYYWREGRYEVDYVLKRGRNIWAIEVKSHDTKNHKGLEAFKDKYPDSKSVLISLENYTDFEKNPIQFLERFGV